MGWTTSEWNHYWSTSGPPQDVVDAQRRWVQRIKRFGTKRGLRFRSLADFGCGPGIALLELAELYPAASFHGFETSSALVVRNRKKATELGLQNVSFETTKLPTVPNRLTFDFVLCIATLHYVEASLLALQNLFMTIRPGGHLIFNYPNTFTAHWYRENVLKSDEALRRRFALVLHRKNLLSKRKIALGLDRPCRSFWKEVGESMDKANPCVFVTKPRGVGYR
ncbi:MAG: class I SAM-dependent methyltransferase [candidate division NC10 bacterium]